MTLDDERKRFTLRLPAFLFTEIGVLASELGIPVNSLILQILWEWADRKRIDL
jgi:hypothetical protein